MSLIEHVRKAGVVGAGGGGFPAHVKFGAKAEIVIGNGAECEPLLHKDAAVLEHHAQDVVRGMELVMDAVGAREGVLGVKEKKKAVVAAAQAACQGSRVRVHLLGDYYPAGDEYDLVFEVTGKLIPPQGIPLQVGAVVSNVETLAQVAAAAKGHAVTRKMVTIAGAVAQPSTFEVPLGITYRALIEAAGGPTCADPVLQIGGMMMGRTSESLDVPITKTDAGAIVLPREHKTIERKLRPKEAQARIGRSACDQCRYCTEFCPRFLLGYAVEPHQVMRGLGFTSQGTAQWNPWASLCCSCGLCTLYACPEDLYPKEACDDAKVELKATGFKWTGPAPTKPHPFHDGRHVPIERLVSKLGITAWDKPAPLRPLPQEPSRLVLPLKQSAGVAVVPAVKAGQKVKAGELLGEPPAGALGALLHAPVAGRIESVTDVIVLVRA
ncbi:MAG: 4Fe-4S dicluster domain-containing protein [Vicinamibacteria bacterium]|jgi:Na+-translocating ferredoxin:NAD+ oxidoreductase RnfC subunit|nr:4Fe-4S dicluster domain-containing protein [Vicinamibacteria bacterium]